MSVYLSNFLPENEAANTIIMIEFLYVFVEWSFTMVSM